MNISHFPDVIKSESSFASNNGQMLKGYIYTPVASQPTAPKGVVIISHGLGGGHNDKLPHINYFVKNGYVVYGFDGTGCDESEGDSVIGLPQAVIDLSYAIDHVSGNIPSLSGLPIVLFGQSWGAYAATAALCDHPDNIKAVVSLSGFSEAETMIFDQCKTLIGPLNYGVVPYIRLLNWLKFKDTAFQTGVKGIMGSSAQVLIVHGKFDPVVGFENYEEYFNNFLIDNNVFFKTYPDRRDRVDYTPAQREKVRAALDDVNSELSQYEKIEDAPPDTVARLEKKVFDAYSQLDKSLMDLVVDFFDRSLSFA